MPTFTIDASQIASPVDFWREYLVKVQPAGAEHFGRNFSALRDGLRGGPGYPGDNAVIVVLNHKSSPLGSDFFEGLTKAFEGASSRLELR